MKLDEEKARLAKESGTNDEPIHSITPPESSPLVFVDLNSSSAAEAKPQPLDFPKAA